MKVGVVRFIRAAPIPARKLFRRQPEAWHVMGEGFTWETQDRARDVATAEAAWQQACAAAATRHQPGGAR